ncbi:molybdate ABC transporter substrate-binding protein [Cellulomonas sp. McL0617]|uniref:molybdate ABC transporter substrate-binding protein n=1 Tax=Cellulomonas sp. McL0617 TaxID=3415675 RepID=UPI003CFB74BC
MKVRALVVASGLLLGLAACASDNTPASTPTPTPTVSATPALTGELTVFAAASLQGTFDAILKEFAAENPGVTVNPATYDGSSTLATQLVGGASADVFASADEKNMQTVTAAGLVDGTPTIFTTNTLEIVVPAGNPKNITSLQDLGTLSDAGGKVVICAAEVPCGSAAHKVLDTAGVGVTPASNEQNVKAVLAKVQAGEADAGLVYKTDVQAAGDTVEGVEFPESSAAVNTYPIAVLTEPLPRKNSAEVAQAFVDLVLGPKGQAILKDAGFVAP